MVRTYRAAESAGINIEAMVSKATKLQRDGHTIMSMSRKMIPPVDSKKVDNEGWAKVEGTTSTEGRVVGYEIVTSFGGKSGDVSLPKPHDFLKF